MKFIFKKSWLLTRSTSFRWSKTRSWKFKIQNHKILSSRVKGLLKIKHLVRIFNLMDFLFLKIELPVTSILQYLKTFNWSQCIQAKIDSNIPSPGRKGSLKIPTRCPATPANFDKHSNSSLYLQYQGFTVPIIENIESPSWFSFT